LPHTAGKKEYKQGITSLSLKDLMKGNKNTSDNQTANSSNTQGDNSYNQMNELVTQQKLTEAWANYAEKIKPENVRLYSILTGHQPKIQQETIILVELANPIQADDLLKEKPALMSYLKRLLRNTQLELQTTVGKNDEKAPEKIFTAADKLEAMMKKNSALALLKQQFNLDLD